MATSCDAVADGLTTFGRSAVELAEAIEVQADVLAGILESILDIALAGSLAYMFAAATAWTGIGGVVGFLAGSAAFGRAVWLAAQAWEVIQQAQTFLDFLIAGTGVVQGLSMRSPVFELPAAYENSGM